MQGIMALLKKDIVGAIYHHRDCIGHSIQRHPETPVRIVSMLKELRRNWPPEVFREAPLVTDDQILLFHTEEHLNSLKAMCDESERFRKPIHIDGDTAVMCASRHAILRAAGSIVAAIDDIYTVSSERRMIRFVA